MAYTAPTVNYSTSINGTYTSLTGIQSVSISRGRQRFDDNFAGNNCVIELIPATSYATPLALGQFIDVRTTNAAGSPAYFVGTITDIERKYAIPYNTSTGLAPADRIIISATGTTGVLGKQTLSTYTTLERSCTTEINVVAQQANATVPNIFPTETTVKNSAETLTDIGVLDLINGLLRTCQYYIDDIDNKRVSFSGYNFVGATFSPGVNNSSYTFSDAGTSGALKFTDLQYLSSVQNTFTQVIVYSPAYFSNPVAFAGSPPYNTLNYYTYSLTNPIGGNLGFYIVSNQSQTEPVPFSITTNTMAEPNCTNISVMTTSDALTTANLTVNLGAAITVIFRGNTVFGCVEGINTTFYLDHANVQLFLSSSFGAPFTLDSSAFGVLDTNRLGFP
jgi:hypothetical protein